MPNILQIGDFMDALPLRFLMGASTKRYRIQRDDAKESLEWSTAVIIREG